MNHLGDITKVNGSEIEPVDCIIGGSPCQGLSLAGKGKGLQDERSGLFMEQIRIVKEMRDATANIFPRFMVWENVPGAFSTNKGEDFQAVLEETVRIVEKSAVIPQPPKGKWRTSGCIMGDGWSIAWRVLDAQFWGVPQRRRRIALVADFRGQSAPEVLFVRKSVQGDSQESEKPRKRASGNSENHVGKAVTMRIRCGKDGGGKGPLIQKDKSGTLSTHNDQVLFAPDVPCVCFGISAHDSNSMKSPNPHSGIYEADTSRTIDTSGLNPGCNQGGIVIVQPTICLNDQGGICMNVSVDVAGTLRSQMGGHPPIVLDSNCLNPEDPQRYRVITKDGVCPTLDAASGGGAHGALILDDGPGAVALDCRSMKATYELSGMIQTNGGSLNHINPVKVNKIVRRLTPLECERLQDFSDNWTDIGDWTDSKGKKQKSSDTARYKAIGNSIALPPWKWLLKRISAQYERDATMGSLFDGIGGFVFLWRQINGPDSVKWASEIDEFCIAITKKRFT